MMSEEAGCGQKIGGEGHVIEIDESLFGKRYVKTKVVNEKLILTDTIPVVWVKLGHATMALLTSTPSSLVKLKNIVFNKITCYSSLL